LANVYREQHEFLDLGDRKKQAAAMAAAVRLNHSKKLYTATMVLIVCYIDALAGGTQRKYLSFLRRYFADLCAELKPELFYDRYRNGMAHLFRPKAGFGLAENHELKGNYYGPLLLDPSIGGKGQRIYVINVDRLAKDFLAAADAIAAGTSVVEGVPTPP
jgi:hypothetical protein